MSTNRPTSRRTLKGLLLAAGIATLTAALPAGPAKAVPIPSTTLHYDEAVHGDLVEINTGTSIIPPTLGTLGLGDNTVSGSTSAGPGSGVTDFDRFRFFVPDGAQLVSIGLAFSNVMTTGSVTDVGDVRSLVFDPDGSGALFLGTGTLYLLGATSPADLSSDYPLPVGAGLYQLNNTVARRGSSTTSPGVGSYDYTLTLTVAAVDTPEPGTLALLTVGLAGFGWVRRRKAS